MKKDDSNTNNELAAILTNLGLNETEIKVFSFLILQDSGLKATEISYRTRINRTTLYGVLQELSHRGLVAASELRGVQVFQSIQPHLLIDYIEREREKLSASVKQVRNLLPTLNDLRSNHEGYRPQIKFYDGTNGIKQVYEELMSDNKEKRVHGFTGAQAAFRIMTSDWIDYVWKKRPAMGVHWDAIAVSNSETRAMGRKDKEHLRTTRFLPPEYQFDVELAAYDDKTLIMSFAKDHPLAIQITDKHIAETVKAIFKFVNDTLKSKPPQDAAV